MAANLAYLYPGVEIVEAYAFRVTRDADIEIQEDEADDLLRTIERASASAALDPSCASRSTAMSPHMRGLLTQNLGVARRTSTRWTSRLA